MVKITKEVMDMLNDSQASKVLATSDSGGSINVVTKGSLVALDEETIAFADIFGGKTNVNLSANTKTTVAAFKTDLPPVGYQIKGIFQGFQTSGPVFDNFAAQIKSAMNIDIKAVGIINPSEVYAIGVPNPGAKIA